MLLRVAVFDNQGAYGVERMSTTNYPPQSFESMSRKQAITTCYALEDMRDRALARNERQRATLAKIRTIVTGHEAALVVGRVLAALDEGSTQPEGTK